MPYSNQTSFGHPGVSQFPQAPSSPMVSQVSGGSNMNLPPQFAMFQQPLVQGMAIQYSQQLATTGKAMVNRSVAIKYLI